MTEVTPALAGSARSLDDLAATAFSLLLSPQCGKDHGCGATYTALYLDGSKGAVQLTRAALHTRIRAHDMGDPVIHRKDAMGTNIHAHAATRTQS